VARLWALITGGFRQRREREHKTG